MARLSAVEEELNQARAGEDDAAGQPQVEAADGGTGALEADTAQAEQRNA
jgi:hypothetical protein